jgi:hypothetical protein
VQISEESVSKVASGGFTYTDRAKADRYKNNNGPLGATLCLSFVFLLFSFLFFLFSFCFFDQRIVMELLDRRSFLALSNATFIGRRRDAGDAGDAGEDPRTLARRSMAVANFSNLLTNPFNFIYR